MASRKKKTDRIRDWYQSIPERIREITTGSIFLLVAIFLTLVSFDLAGVAGEKIKMFLIKGEELAFFGWSFYFIIILFYSLGTFLILSKEIVSHIRLWSGVLLGMVSLSTFLAASFNESAGGRLGTEVFAFLSDIIGFFVYILLPILILLSLYILKIFNPTKIWEWVANEEDYDDEDYEDEEPEEEEEDEEEEDYEDEEPEEEEEEEEIDDEEPEEEEEEIDDEYEEDEEVDKEYVFPSLEILGKDKGQGKNINTKSMGQSIQRTLKNFNINVEIENITVGPTFTRYSVKPAEGVRLSKITSLQQNIELALAAHPVRIEAPIPGKSLVGIEVPNSTKAVVGVRGLFESKEYEECGGIPVVFGKTISGKIFVKDLTKNASCIGCRNNWFW